MDESFELAAGLLLGLADPAPSSFDDVEQLLAHHLAPVVLPFVEARRRGFGGLEGLGLVVRRPNREPSDSHHGDDAADHLCGYLAGVAVAELPGDEPAPGDPRGGDDDYPGSDNQEQRTTVIALARCLSRGPTRIGCPPVDVHGPRPVISSEPRAEAMKARSRLVVLRV